MLDDFSHRSRAVRAAFELAQERFWLSMSLADIAERAGLGLADLRREFASTSDILRAFQADVDAETLARAPARPEWTPRERLFDIIMTRFEVMEPYKPALKRISSELRFRPVQAAILASTGVIRASTYGYLITPVYAAVYAKVFRAWLDDPSPALDRTMAVLERRLRRAEQWLTPWRITIAIPFPALIVASATYLFATRGEASFLLWPALLFLLVGTTAAIFYLFANILWAALFAGFQAMLLVPQTWLTRRKWPALAMLWALVTLGIGLAALGVLFLFGVARFFLH